MAATIKDVAKKAGVSISTVSRVINDSKPVSSEIRKRVLEVIEELEYKPNEVARSLVTKKSYLIGVIVTDLGDSYVAEMVRGIEEVGKMYDYDILLCSTFGDKEAELKYLRLLNTKQVEGIILISNTLNNELHEKTKQLRIPFVYLNRFYYQDYPTVKIDNFEASYEMTNYLIGLGHKDIAYISNNGDKFYLEKDKLEGYKKAISEHEDCEEIIYFSKDRDIEDGYDVARDIIGFNKEVTAIFCSYDELAIGVLNYLYDNDIKVPDEISVTGFGDIKIASIFRPTLTTIKEPFYDIGAVAIRRIIKELKGEIADNSDIILPFQIQKRGSSIKIK
ncbi:HTH-type transcriptional regulator [Gottschalkia acidurici 9a]|uniref:HTH-type transcriptional regulator n=1 Tax=Gottschalkia acidurici (strain ATCC 7906 / DSM 604 / BCRC 14475 / CIP 104303 / KCTC 5404 / NCIMB 10678 / 9a) TaxID=1128398 RepID=K0AYX8_GOTA9|nr:LacI family DNA-binding transcriptional regulator [Gottschalkia acidurici]AFS77997.1 HTH-type transcriptional regulator [Gottschalkia acidurici 9a]